MGVPALPSPLGTGAPGVAPETTRERTVQPKSPTRKPAVMGRSTRSSAQHGFGCQCKLLWRPGTLMSPAHFPERSLDWCHWVGGLTAQHTPRHAGEPLHPPSPGTHRFWVLRALDAPLLSPQERKASPVPTVPPSRSILTRRVQSPVPPLQRWRWGEIPRLHAARGSCRGTGLRRVPPLPLHHLPAPPHRALLLRGGCSVAWRASGPTPPQQPPSPTKGPGKGKSPRHGRCGL